MARMIVQYPIDVEVLVDGQAAGRTNRVIVVAAGTHTVTLAGETTDPATQAVTAGAEGPTRDLLRPRFAPAPASAPLDRFSPLYCVYNGALLGLFVALSFAEYGRKDYHVRRARMSEFLAEIDVDVDIPADPPGIGSDEHAALLDALLPRVAARSPTLAEFVALGGMLAHYGILAHADPATARDCREQCERIRGAHDLPPLDYDSLVLPGAGVNVDTVLSPILVYVARIVDTLPVEPKTAFVIMPFKPPYSGYFSTLYRPSLEQAGFRAFRAWGGLSSEDYCDLLLKLISKAGIVWADVSERNENVLYEIGAAHAFGKLGMIVVREDFSAGTPANIGHDAVVRYAPDGADWPDGTVRLMAALASALELAAERGERLRITPQRLSATLDHIGSRLAATVIPPEAYAARQEGQQKFAEHDYAAAEQAFDDAVTLGLDDALTHLGRGLARYALDRFDDAESDLDAYVAAADEAPEGRGSAAYFRGLAREQQGKLPGARDDYQLAIEHGYGTADPVVFHRLATVLIALQQYDAAAAAIEHARAAAPGHLDNDALEGDLLAAQSRFDDAVAAYERALQLGASTEVTCNRALALLLSGRAQDALEAYREASGAASESERRWALEELRRRAPGAPGMADCEAALQ